jgi:hypothetical protein
MKRNSQRIKLDPVQLAEWNEARLERDSVLSQNDVSSSWKNAEMGTSAARPKRTRFKSCVSCKCNFNPDSDYSVRLPDVPAYEFKERALFKSKDLCLDCLEEIESVI